MSALKHTDSLPPAYALVRLVIIHIMSIRRGRDPLLLLQIKSKGGGDKQDSKPVLCSKR